MGTAPTKTIKPDLGSKRNFSKIAGPQNDWFPYSVQDARDPETLRPCVISLITLAKTGADEFTPRDEFSCHPRTTTIFTQSQLKTIPNFFPFKSTRPNPTPISHPQNS